MGYKIVWVEPAIHDLKEIVEYIAEDNTEAALRIGHEVIDHVGILEGFPFIGSCFPRYSKSSVHEILCLKYRIFYRINEKAKVVEILRVWHTSRDEPKREDLV
jgi:plasmid stabilization system protein ParE